jgi:O-antigen/teichoic acid export membrane protein
MSNTKTIARNTGWYGLENIISSVVGLVTSIAIARTLGPTKMAPIILVTLIASVVGTLGGLGVPATTQKYMAEFLGMGDRGTARHIYLRTLMLQIAMATIATAGILFWVLRHSGPGYKLACALVALSIWPSMVNFISAQANVASEELSANLPASVISIFVFFIAIISTVIFKWGVVGVGASMLLMRASDFLIRLIPTMKRILAWDTTHVHPEGLGARMLGFSWQSVATMVVALIVWDRSEIFLLDHLCADIRQISFYSVAFNMSERLLIGSAVFGSAAGATIFAQYGRDKSRIPAVAASSFRYLALTSIPLHVIATALAYPALVLLYGNKYQDAAMVVTLAPILCMPKAFIGPVQSMLQSAERQSYVIVATILAGIVDIGVAWWLIRTHGAVGACIGSGAAQITAVGLMWAIGIHHYHVKLPWMQVAKITFISVAASLSAHYTAIHFKPLWAVLLGGSASLVVLFGLFYLMRVLEPEDHSRFKVITGIMPKRISAIADKFLTLLIRPGVAETEANATKSFP